jgi:hypothetical protein
MLRRKRPPPLGGTVTGLLAGLRVAKSASGVAGEDTSPRHVQQTDWVFSRACGQRLRGAGSPALIGGRCKRRRPPGCRRACHMGHYRFYQLDVADRIKGGYSVECGSDAAALRAARTLLQRSAAVEVWRSNRRVARLGVGARRLWGQMRRRWMSRWALDRYRDWAPGAAVKN